MSFTFDLTEEALALFLHIAKEGYAEYRDTEYPTLASLIEDENRPSILTGESYLNRNCGGTYYCIDQLLEYGLIDSDSMSWHTTYVLSNLGKLVLLQNDIDYK